MEKDSNQHFCNCPVTKCKRHPNNHNEGCDPCIKDNLQKKKMPACFFFLISNDMSGVKEFSIKSFVELYMKHNDIK